MKKSKLIKKVKRLKKGNEKLYQHLVEVCEKPDSEKSQIIKSRIRMQLAMETAIWKGSTNFRKNLVDSD